jgi:hypothetical protein
MPTVKAAWKWLTFVGEILSFLLFTSAAYLVPTPDRKYPVSLLLTACFAVVFALLSSREFQRSGRDLKENPPLVMLFVVGGLQIIVGLLKFVIFP